MATEMKFEDALKKLEKIAADLEAGDLSLDDSLKRYEEGVRLACFCSKKLESAKNKVKILVKAGAGKFEVKPFERENAGED